MSIDNEPKQRCNLFSVFEAPQRWVLYWNDSDNMKYRCLMTDWPLTSFVKVGPPTLKSLYRLYVGPPGCTPPMIWRWKDIDWVRQWLQTGDNICFGRPTSPASASKSGNTARPPTVHSWRSWQVSRKNARRPFFFLVSIVAEKGNYDDAGPWALLCQAVPQRVNKHERINVLLSHQTCRNSACV